MLPVAEALNDPILAFLDGRSTKDTCNTRDGELVTKASQMRHTLLWRQDPEHSFSDWTLEITNLEPFSIGSQEIAEARCSSKKRKTETGDASSKNDDSDEEATSTTYHVNRCIIASVSTYFRSQLGEHTYTQEQRNRRSTINLHPNAAKAFPVFLDYVYNRDLGRLGFSRKNAAALRHLAMYFGVDMLLKDITDVILLDMKSKQFREICHDEARVLHDEKLLEAVRMQNVLHETSLSVAPVLFEMIKQNAEDYFHGDSDGLSAWKKIVGNIDAGHDAFFAARSAETFPNICVLGADLEQVNGVYKLVGKHGGAGLYSNGIFSILREVTDAWYIAFCYDKDNRDNTICLYRCESPSDHPPSRGWYQWRHLECYWEPQDSFILVSCK